MSTTPDSGKQHSKANQLLQTLNSQPQTIKFELELPAEDNYLSLLDMVLKMNHHGSLSHQLHAKSASKQIPLHYDSHHPDTTKTVIVTKSNELKRAKTNSSVDNVTGSTKTAITKLINNGYPTGIIKQVERAQGRNQRRKQRRRTADPLTFHLPFISNRVNREIRKALVRR